MISSKKSLLSLILTVAMLMTTLSVGFAMPVAAAEGDATLVALKGTPTVDGEITAADGWFFSSSFTKETSWGAKTTHELAALFDETNLYLAIKTKGNNEQNPLHDKFNVCLSKNLKGEGEFSNGKYIPNLTPMNDGTCSFDTWGANVTSAKTNYTGSMIDYVIELEIPLTNFEFDIEDGAETPLAIQAIGYNYYFSDSSVSIWNNFNGFGTLKFADYTPDEVLTVTYNGAGAKGAMGSVVVVPGQEIALPSCTFTAPIDSTFTGWKGADGQLYNVGDTVTINESTTFTAVWKLGSEIVVFDDALSSNFKHDASSWLSLGSAAADTSDYAEGSASYAVNYAAGKDNSILQLLPGDNKSIKIDSSFINNYSFEFYYKADTNVSSDLNIIGFALDGESVKYQVSLQNYYTDIGEWQKISVPLTSCSYVKEWGGTPAAAFDFDRALQYIRIIGHTKNNSEPVPVYFDEVRFVKTTYDLTLVANNGTGRSTTTSGNSGTINVPGCPFDAPEGMKFDGWLINGEPVETETLEFTDDIVLTASWVEDEGSGVLFPLFPTQNGKTIPAVWLRSPIYQKITSIFAPLLSKIKLF